MLNLVLVLSQVWTCGGSIEIIPCSKIAHIERAHKPYALDLSVPLKRNALRVAEVWMDDYKSNVLISWNLPLKVCSSGLLFLNDVELTIRNCKLVIMKFCMFVYNIFGNIKVLKD